MCADWWQSALGLESMNSKVDSFTSGKDSQVKERGVAR